MKQTIDISNLKGRVYELYHSNNEHSFILGDTEFTVIEDEMDGYRSAMECVEYAPIIKRTNNIYCAEILIKDSSKFDGYDLVDNSGHIWCSFGTDNYDDWYPCFRYEWNPKPQEIVQQIDKESEKNDKFYNLAKILEMTIPRSHDKCVEAIIIKTSYDHLRNVLIVESENLLFDTISNKFIKEKQNSEYSLEYDYCQKMEKVLQNFETKIKNMK